MIVKEFHSTRSDGVKLYRTYSDKNFKIKQVETEAVYDEAIDVENSKYTYVETDELIDQEEVGEQELKAKAYDIIVGEVE